MTDKLFVYDYKTDKSYFYGKLLADLNSITEVREYSCNQDLYTTFLMLISGILHNQNLVLLDSDVSEQELQNLNLSKTDLLRSKTVSELKISSVEELLVKLKEHRDWQLTLFTSGTTGIPKKVVHTLSTLIRAVRISERHNNDVWGFAYNPAHIAGLQVFFQALLNGNAIINLFEAGRDDILHLVKNYGVTNISATPTFYRLLLPLSDSYPSVRKLTSGGEKFDARLTEALLKAFPNAGLRNVYASTEAGTILESKDDTFSISDETLCKIVNDEFFIHKSLLGEGEGIASEDEDWYATGDLVETLEHNPLRFRFLQRKNEMINVGGYKVNPYEVEQVLETHSLVRQAYVYGKANPVLGNILMADIVTSEVISERELREFLNPLLQPFKIPRVISFVKSIELTRTGKLKRN
ncbi:MAG: long-chain fatty acid--CoA ligase [Candidatus Cloacimonadaceae bacterium]